MKSPPIHSGAPDYATLSRSLLDTAAEVEAAEARIKQEILDAARRGDCDRIIEIVTSWQKKPPTDVLS